MVITSALHAEGRGFDPRLEYFIIILVPFYSSSKHGHICILLQETRLWNEQIDLIESRQCDVSTTFNVSSLEGDDVEKYDDKNVQIRIADKDIIEDDKIFIGCS